MDAVIEASGRSKIYELINTAQGSRSLSEYSRSCGISAAQLSRVKNGVSTPSKRLCLRMANERYTQEAGITSALLLKAAGYDEKDAMIVQAFDDNMAYREKVLVIGIICRAFSDRGWKFQPLPSSFDNNSDFAFDVEEENKTKLSWEFCQRLSQKISGDSNHGEEYYYLYGRIVSLERDDSKQLTIITADKALYEQLINGIHERLVEANVSIVLVDLTAMDIKKEDVIGHSGHRIKTNKS